MKFRDAAKVMLNLALIPEVVDVFVAGSKIESKYVSADIKVGTKETVVFYDAPLTEDVNAIVCVMDEKVRNAINELKEKLQ